MLSPSQQRGTLAPQRECAGSCGWQPAPALPNTDRCPPASQNQSISLFILASIIKGMTATAPRLEDTMPTARPVCEGVNWLSTTCKVFTAPHHTPPIFLILSLLQPCSTSCFVPGPPCFQLGVALGLARHPHKWDSLWQTRHLGSVLLYRWCSYPWSCLKSFPILMGCFLAQNEVHLGTCPGKDTLAQQQLNYLQSPLCLHI